MHRIASGALPGGGFFIACGRRPPRKKCATCQKQLAGLECDGCDKPLCAGCAVSPKKGIDFDPACFKPAWEWWIGQHAARRYLSQTQRRREFREWARENADDFLGLVPLGTVAKAAR